MNGSVVLTLHQGFARVLLIYTAVLVLWGLWLWIRNQPPSGSYLGAIAIDWGVAVLQGLIGVALLAQGHRPHDNLHYLYGVLAALTYPTAYLYSERGTTRRDSLIFALVSLFLIGIAIRGFTTGGT